MSFDEVISLWQEDRPLYEKLTEHLYVKLYEITSKQGIHVKISTRTKDEISLIKKLYKKKQNDLSYYSSMTDKSGARVVCRFKEDVEAVKEYIQNEFIVIKIDDNIHNLDYNQQGYKSIHFDVKLKENNTSPELYSKIGDL
jgi:ppGpp synthetase/RelA/SpoT-type nucleotidyltranferase